MTARRLERGVAGTRLGDERLPVEQEHAPVLLGHGERPVERRRQPQRHLGRAVDEGCEPARRVAAVGRVQRAAEAAVDREGVFA